MTTAATTTVTISPTFSAMSHLRFGEKLGLSSASSAMLFPAPAFDDTQREEQEEQRQTHVENDSSRIDHTAGEIMHLIEKGERGQQFVFPISLGRKPIGQHAETENSPARDQGNHG